MRVQPRIRAIPINNAVPAHAHVVVASPSRIEDAAETVLMLRAQAPGAVLIVAFPRPDVDTTIAVVLAGAAGVVDLNASDETLAHSLDTVITDGAYVPGPLQAPVLAALAERRRNAVRNRERLASLSPRERCVLELLDSGQDRAAIAERLQVSPHRVRATIDRAKAKLGASTQRQAVAFFGDRLTPER
jgi:DNA-binding NarL/FixJ family response regulator